MSTILLPALRSERVNLYRHEVAGAVGTGTSGFVQLAPDPVRRVYLSEVGLSPGGVISFSAEVRALTSGMIRPNLTFRDKDDVQIDGDVTTNYVDTQEFMRLGRDSVVIPQGAHSMFIYARNLDLVEAEIRRPVINRGPVSMPYDIPKRGAYAPMTHAFLERENRQSLINYYAGASQLTSLPSRQWQLSFETPILEGDELREWSMALHELSDQGNVFRFTPPEYQGPSTGYQGANPVVSGASQLGTTLTCSGVDPETEILGPGDFLSFDVTTPRGNTNVELNRVRSLATSDEEGNVTFELARPIRLAPADGATVQIFAPTGQFRLRNPRGGIDLGLMRRATVSIDAIEAIFL